jgi:hypothetical protein
MLSLQAFRAPRVPSLQPQTLDLPEPRSQEVHDKSSVMLFYKLYDPATQRLSFLGRVSIQTRLLVKVRPGPGGGGGCPGRSARKPLVDGCWPRTASGGKTGSSGGARQGGGWAGQALGEGHLRWASFPRIG